MNRNLRIALAMAALAAVAACNRVTAENYAKVRVGMDYAQVTDLLGNPSNCNAVAGFKSCRWGDDKSGATIRFAGDKVVLHSAQNIR